MLIHEHLQGVVRRPPRVATAGRVAPECGDTEPEEATVYDIASLTKVVATWPVIGHAVDTGLMELDVPVRAYLRPIDGSATGGTPRCADRRQSNRAWTAVSRGY